MQDAIKQIPTIIFKQQFSTKDRRRNELHKKTSNPVGKENKRQYKEKLQLNKQK